MLDYADFLDRKADSAHGAPMRLTKVADRLYPFQQALLDWSATHRDARRYSPIVALEKRPFNSHGLTL